MSYLLDTNVISELRKKEPNPRVVNWVSERPSALLYLSVLTLGELRKGVEASQDSVRKSSLRDWLELELPSFFAGRILNIDSNVADNWGRIVAHAGRPIPVIDSLLAATASEFGFTFITRNKRDFECLGVDVINPWELN